jgi:AraC family transcriptional regulator, regulatory protein of adaptative response / methylated-DNA-[protein]-cysteine methyltransferase
VSNTVNSASSAGRQRAGADEGFAIASKRARDAGKRERLTFAFAKSSLGDVLVAASAKGIVAVLIGDDRDRLTTELGNIFRNAQFILGDRQFDKTVAHVVGLIESPTKPLDLPLDIRGTPFQRRVWKALQAIPLGKTDTYPGIAEKIGHPKAVRAVGHACAVNPLAIVIPCHRVVRVDGNMAGYRWGIDRKRVLIEREAVSGKRNMADR